jgi:glutamyl-tRNA synthetase
MFDVKKLEAVNGEYIRSMEYEEFSDALLPWIADQPWNSLVDRDQLSRVAPLVQERTRVLAEGPPQLDFFFLETPEIDESAWEKAMTTAEAPLILDSTQTAFSTVDWTVAALHESLRAIGDSLGMKLGKAQAPVRVAITGRLVGPPLFESLHALGRDAVLERIVQAQNRLAGV